MPTKLKELKSLQKLLRTQKRSPLQLNQLFSSDSELLKLDSQNFLSLSTDGLSEEFEDGIYTDPETLGWMSVVMSLSDVACSGAKPLGVLLSVNWKKKTSEAWKKKFFRGVQSCLKAHKTFLLGGDSGESQHFSVVSTAVAKGQKPAKQRKGIRAGDWLVAFQPIGMGAVIAFDFLTNKKRIPQTKIRPNIPYSEIQKGKHLCKAMIDNSDGLLNTLAILSDLNKVHFKWNLTEKLFHADAKRFCTKQSIPLSSLIWAELGGYEIIASVASKDLKQFLRQCPKAIPFARATKKHDGKIDLFQWQNSKKTYKQKMDEALNE